MKEFWRSFFLHGEMRLLPQGDEKWSGLVSVKLKGEKKDMRGTEKTSKNTHVSLSRIKSSDVR